MLRRKRHVNLSMKSSMNRNNVQNIQRNPIKVKLGDKGENVNKIQGMIVDLIEFYPSIPKIEIDGIFGENTKKAVKRFQELMGIYDTGNVDLITWNKLHLIHSKKNALKCNQRSDVTDEGIDESNNVVKMGSKGSYVTELQEYINKVANLFPAIPKVKIDGIFGEKTKEAVITFQRMFSLEADGVVGEITWATLYNASLGKLMPNS